MKWFTELSKPIKAMIIIGITAIVITLIVTNQFLPFLGMIKSWFA